MWVDEYWTVVLTVPMVMAFVPLLDGQVTKGFVALHNAPQWYVDAVGAAVLFAFGRRALRGVHMPHLKEYRPLNVRQPNPAAAS